MATFHQLKNNAFGTVQNSPSLLAAGTNLQTDAGIDAILSAVTFPYWLTIWGANLNPNNDAGMEIVEVTARPSAQNYTIVRAKQGTAASIHLQGSNLGLLWTLGNAQEAAPLTDTVAQGDIYYIGSDLLPHLLAPGANGTVLTSQGAAANPIWTSGVGIVFGDGSDGNITISSPTTLTRDMYYNNLTVTSTLTTDGYRIYVKGTLNGAGTITFGTGSGSGFFKVNPGGTGGVGHSNTNGNIGTTPSATNAIGTITAAGAGGLGGQGSTGPATGGTATACVQKFGILANLTYLGLDFSLLGTFTPLTPSSAGAGGSGGGGTGGSAIGGTGGSGGNSGGTVWISAAVWAGTFTIAAPGNVGSNGSNFSSGSGGAGGGGGGGGGNGGVTVMIYGTKSWTGIYNIAGGAGGSGGSGSGANAGSAGSAGSAGISYEFIAASAFLR